MPTILQRLASLFPSFLRSGGNPAAAADDVVKAAQADLRHSTRRERPETDEKVPRNYHAGIAGKIWFYPYLDSTTKDSPDIRAAMRRMRTDPYVKTAWEPQILTVASEDYQVQAYEPGNPESEEQAAFCKATIDEFIDGGMPHVVRSICAPLGSDGFSLAEKVWDVVNRGRYRGYVTARALKARDAEATQIRLEGDVYGNVMSVKSLRAKEQRAFPISDFVYSRYMTVFDEPMGEAAFRPVYGCYDDETEILTRDGWKLFKDLTDADAVATLEPASGRMVYEVPKERRSFPYKGKMFRQKSKFIDLRVTPNHRMWIGSRQARKFRIVEARQLMDGSISKMVRYKRDAVWEGEEKEYFTLPAIEWTQENRSAGRKVTRHVPAKLLPMDDWLKFLGFWLAEGSAYRGTKGNRQSWVTLTQKPGPVLDEMRAVVRRLGFNAHYRAPSGARSVADLRISNLQLWTYLKQFGKSYDKYVPADIKQLGSRQLRILLDWMLKGDGRHDFGEGKTQYCTVSKRLADDVSELVLKTGRAANVYREKATGHSRLGYIWCVSINKQGIDATLVNEHDQDGRSWEEYDGPVSCVTTTNGIVYVRRNGKACWCGNSYWMRDTVRKLRIIHHEKKMAGFLVGEYEDPNDKAPLESALRNAKSATWAAIPAGVKIQALQLSTAAEPDYRSFDESLRDEIVQGIALATLQTLQGNIPDARGDSKVQKATADLCPWFLMVLVQEAVNKQLFPDLIDFNYPYPAGGGYPKLTFGSVSNAELLELVELVQSYENLGFTLSKKHYAKALSVQQADPNDPEDALSPGGMQPPGQQQQAGGPAVGEMPAGDPYAGQTPFAGDPSQAATPFGAEAQGDTAGEASDAGGAPLAFAEGRDENGVWFLFREPVKWTQQENGTWKSEGGRVLSDAAYQRHIARLKNRARQLAARNPRRALPAGHPAADHPAEPPPQKSQNPQEPAPQHPALPHEVEAPAWPKAPAENAPHPGGDPDPGHAPLPAGTWKWEIDPETGEWSGPVAETPADRRKAILARGRRAVAGAARGARKATAGAADRLARLQALGGRAIAIPAKGLAVAARDLGGLIARVAGNVPIIGAVGRAIEAVGRRNAIRFGIVNREYKKGALAGNKAFSREVVRNILGVRFKESRRKYGLVLGTAVEAAMFGWTWGKGALLGAATAGVGGAIGGAAADFALSSANEYLTKILGFSVAGTVRNALEGAARGASNLATGHTPTRRNPGAAGRVAMAIEWAEGLHPRKLARALSGKGTFALGHVSGDRRSFLSGRGGSITRHEAATWLAKKRELARADAEGRDPNLSPAEVATLRRAAEISLGGRTLATTRGGDTVASGVPIAGRPEDVAAARAHARERLGILETDRRGRPVASRRFAEDEWDAGDAGDAGVGGSYVPEDLVVDLRESVDELRRAVGLPPVDATDDELAGSLAVVLAMMKRKYEEAAGPGVAA